MKKSVLLSPILIGSDHSDKFKHGINLTENELNYYAGIIDKSFRLIYKTKICEDSFRKTAEILHQNPPISRKINDYTKELNYSFNSYKRSTKTLNSPFEHKKTNPWNIPLSTDKILSNSHLACYKNKIENHDSFLYNTKSFCNNNISTLEFLPDLQYLIPESIDENLDWILYDIEIKNSIHEYYIKFIDKVQNNIKFYRKFILTFNRNIKFKRNFINENADSLLFSMIGNHLFHIFIDEDEGNSYKLKTLSFSIVSDSIYRKARLTKFLKINELFNEKYRCLN